MQDDNRSVYSVAFAQMGCELGKCITAYKGQKFTPKAVRLPNYKYPGTAPQPTLSFSLVPNSCPLSESHISEFLKSCRLFP